MKRDFIANAIFQAQESVCYGEALRSIYGAEQNIEQLIRLHTKEEISKRSKNAVSKRNKQFNELKLEFLIYFYTGEFFSNADAARRFYRSLPKDRKIYLSEEHAVRNFTKAIRDAS